jgi:hypothetical protein
MADSIEADRGLAPPDTRKHQTRRYNTLNINQGDDYPILVKRYMMASGLYAVNEADNNTA